MPQRSWFQSTSVKTHNELPVSPSPPVTWSVKCVRRGWKHGTQRNWPGQKQAKWPACKVRADPKVGPCNLSCVPVGTVGKLDFPRGEIFNKIWFSCLSWHFWQRIPHWKRRQAPLPQGHVSKRQKTPQVWALSWPLGLGDGRCLNRGVFSRPSLYHTVKGAGTDQVDEAASWGGSETRKYEYLVGTQGEARKRIERSFRSRSRRWNWDENEAEKDQGRQEKIKYEHWHCYAYCYNLVLFYREGQERRAIRPKARIRWAQYARNFTHFEHPWLKRIPKRDNQKTRRRKRAQIACGRTLKFFVLLILHFHMFELHLL